MTDDLQLVCLILESYMLRLRKFQVANQVKGNTRNQNAQSTHFNTRFIVRTEKSPSPIKIPNQICKNIHVNINKCHEARLVCRSFVWIGFNSRTQHSALISGCWFVDNKSVSRHKKCVKDCGSITRSSCCRQYVVSTWFFFFSNANQKFGLASTTTVSVSIIWAINSVAQ